MILTKIPNLPEVFIDIRLVQCNVDFVRCLRAMGDIITSGLKAAILVFRCRSVGADVDNVLIETADPENMGVAFGISLISPSTAEIQLHPV
jgi:hypothetical protein